MKKIFIVSLVCFYPLVSNAVVLDASIDGTYFVSNALNEQRCEGWDESIDGEWFGADEGDADCSDSRFADVSTGEWAVTFSYGTVKGMAKCSSTNGSWAQTGTPSDTNGQYCWCQATNYTPTNGNQCSVASPAWLFINGRGNTDDCADVCALLCASGVRNGSDFRVALFGNGFNCPTETTDNSANGLSNAKSVLTKLAVDSQKHADKWRNEEGKFNTARLASDLTAGVVLGTVGGVVSGVVIKKKQVERGYEALSCTIGGQRVAGWGETFGVEFRR